jgi:hypothetical protein
LRIFLGRRQEHDQICVVRLSTPRSWRAALRGDGKETCEPPPTMRNATAYSTISGEADRQHSRATILPQAEFGRFRSKPAEDLSRFSKKMGQRGT